MNASVILNLTQIMKIVFAVNRKNFQQNEIITYVTYVIVSVSYKFVFRKDMICVVFGNRLYTDITHMKYVIYVFHIQ